MLPVRPDTIAKSLAIGNPAAGPFALKTIKESDGSGVVALESEVAEGIKLLAETEGIFTETAGGVVISGLKRLVERGLIGSEDVTVAYITGQRPQDPGSRGAGGEHGADRAHLRLVRADDGSLPRE